MLFQERRYYIQKHTCIQRKLQALHLVQALSIVNSSLPRSYMFLKHSLNVRLFLPKCWGWRAKQFTFLALRMSSSCGRGRQAMAVVRLGGLVECEGVAQRWETWRPIYRSGGASHVDMEGGGKSRRTDLETEDQGWSHPFKSNSEGRACPCGLGTLACCFWLREFGQMTDSSVPYFSHAGNDDTTTHCSVLLWGLLSWSMYVKCSLLTRNSRELSADFIVKIFVPFRSTFWKMFVLSMGRPSLPGTSWVQASWEHLTRKGKGNLYCSHRGPSWKAFQDRRHFITKKAQNKNPHSSV